MLGVRPLMPVVRSRLVLRIVMITVLLLAFGQASGIIWFGDDACTQDDCDCGGKQCPPNCPTCACAPTARTTAAPKITLISPAREVRPVEFVALAQFVPSPDPSEILHVPRLAA